MILLAQKTQKKFMIDKFKRKVIKMKETLNELDSGLKNLAKECPEQTNAFFNFLGAVEKDGTLSKKQKEFIAIGISVAVKCIPCIAYHVNELLKLNAKPEEILEAAYVGVLMGGGPALAHMQYVVKAIEELK